MDHSRKSTYLFSIDALRVIAILAVLLIHITTKTMATLHIDVNLAPFSLFLNQTARFAVPLFFLISGFVLELNNKKGLSYITFFKKRASRIIIPYFFWSTVYFLFSNGFLGQKILSFKFIQTLFLGNASYHLYFIPTLIIFYLAFPFLHAMIKFLKNPIFLLIICTVQALLLYQDYYIKQLNISYDLRIAVLSISMFIIGMVASHYKDKIFEIVKRYFIVFLIAIFIIPIFIFFHVKNLTLMHNTSRYIYNQYNPLNYLYTLFIFTTFYFVLERTQFMKKVFIELSKLSFFVFFIHVLIQTLLWDNMIEKLISQNGNLFLTKPWFDPAIFITIASLSFGIAYLIHKIPYLNKITG